MKKVIGALLLTMCLFATSAFAAGSGWACYAHGQKNGQDCRYWDPSSRSEAAKQVLKACEFDANRQSCVLVKCDQE
jgi:hypothetical protein